MKKKGIIFAMGISALGVANVSEAATTEKPKFDYKVHVQNDGWQGWKQGGDLAGTEGRALRLEGLIIQSNVKNAIEYKVHVQNEGWQDWKKNGELAGTIGKAYRLEAVQIVLREELAKEYDIFYKVHVQNEGWQSWRKNGEIAGTQGKALRLEAIQIKAVRKKSNSLPESPHNTKPPVTPNQKPTLNIKDQVTVLQGEYYDPKEAFISATDEQGKAVPFSEIEILNEVDTSETGTIMIYYYYKGLTEALRIHILENENIEKPSLSSLEVKDTTIDYGEVWTPYNNFVKATNSIGEHVGVGRLGVQVEGKVDTNTAGVQTIKYKIDNIEKTANVTVLPMPANQTYKKVRFNEVLKLDLGQLFVEKLNGFRELHEDELEHLENLPNVKKLPYNYEAEALADEWANFDMQLNDTPDMWLPNHASWGIGNRFGLFSPQMSDSELMQYAIDHFEQSEGHRRGMLQTFDSVGSVVYVTKLESKGGAIYYVMTITSFTVNHKLGTTPPWEMIQNKEK